MQKRQVYIGLGVLALAVALALPAFARPRVAGGGGWGMGGGWMMGGPREAQSVTPVTSIDAAAARAREGLGAYGGADLVVAEVMEFSNHFYVLVKEGSTALGALELIVERNGFIHPEPGPNMMWNTKYGHMAGFGRGDLSTQAITRDRARQIAAQYLAQAFPGTTADDGTAFYGYFTFDVERAGKPVGMLSVNGSTGRVWYHTWHGTFVAEKDF